VVLMGMIVYCECCNASMYNEYFICDCCEGCDICEEEQ